MKASLPAACETSGPGETEAWGRDLAAALEPGDVVLLSGELGAGKTCLVKGIAAGLGIDPRTVHSPTFIMVNRYPGSVDLNHVDLYRLEEGEDFSDLSLDELFAGDGITVVEWSERLPDAARPTPRLEILLEPTGENRRRITPRPVRPGEWPGSG
jgi:tRNA threonylcarbamoyladenosine biosynthesis protein TsaE